MTKKEEQFVETVWKFYKCHGRRSLPWRHTKNPYRILVSEVMLQQTQVERVMPKYRDFLKQFPTARVLAEASLGDVLRVWQGLGYNRRAKMLHECARAITKTRTGTVPKTYEELVKLPGVGPYTAGAVLAFAYNISMPIIETNIRSVYLHHFFKGKHGVTDSQIFRLIERTLDCDNAREWYYALMDYGAYLKEVYGNPNRTSAHHVRQSTFKGSDREVRGAIVRALTLGSKTRASLHAALRFEPARINTQLERLAEEHIIAKARGRYSLPV